jgi:hypothetical protein
MSLGALAVLVAAVLYYVFIDGSLGGGGAGAGLGSTMGGSFSGSLSVAEQAYAEGYEDAIAGREPNWAGSNSRRYASAQAASARADSASPPPSSGGSGFLGGFGLGKLFSLALVGRQVYTLGAVPGGGWDFNLARVNVVNLPTMQKIFLGMNVLRLFGMSPI